MLKYFTVRRKLFWQLGPQPKNLQSCSHKHLQAKQMTCTMRNCSQCQSRNSPHKLLSEASWGSSLLWAIWADTQRLSPCCCHPYVLLTDHMLQLHTTQKIAAKTGGKETTELVCFVASFAFKSLLIPFNTWSFQYTALWNNVKLYCFFKSTHTFSVRLDLDSAYESGQCFGG